MKQGQSQGRQQKAWMSIKVQHQGLTKTQLSLLVLFNSIQTKAPSAQIKIIPTPDCQIVLVGLHRPKTFCWIGYLMNSLFPSQKAHLPKHGNVRPGYLKTVRHLLRKQESELLPIKVLSMLLRLRNRNQKVHLEEKLTWKCLWIRRRLQSNPTNHNENLKMELSGA